MNQSPSLLGPQPFTRQQQTYLVAGMALLVIILLATALVAVGGAQLGTGTAGVLLAGVLVAALALGAVAFLFARSFQRTDALEFTQAYQALEAQVLERKSAEETLLEQNKYFGALNETTLALVSHLDLRELLEDILARAGSLVGTQNGYVFLLDPKTNEMVMQVGVGAYQDLIGTKTQPGVALAGKVWQTGDAVAVDDYRNWSGRLADPSRDMLRAVVGVPLKRAYKEDDNAPEQVTGVLGLAHLEADKRFGPTEMDVLNRFAALASIALDNARLYESAQNELTQRRSVESKLAYERDLLQALMDNIPDLIFFKDRESRFVRSNAAHLKNLGATHMDEVFGKTDLDFHADASAHEFMADEKNLLEQGTPILNKVESNPAADGAQRYFLTNKAAWRNADGEIVGSLGVAHDITDRVLAEQFLDSIVENLPTMLFVKEAKDLRFVRWNKAAEKISGLLGVDMLGKNDYELFPSDEAVFFEQKDRETLAQGQVVDIPEEPLQDTSGNIHWLHTKKFPVMGADGKPAYLVGISEDITEQKRATEQVRLTTNFLEQLVTNIPLGVFAKDAKDLRIVRWNRANETISGIKQEEVLGKNDYELFPAVQAAVYVANDRETLESGKLLDIPEEPIHTPDRGVRYLHTKKIPLYDEQGKPSFLLGISEDITESKAAEDALRASEEQYRDLFENANDMITSVKADGTFLYANTAWKNTFGYTDDDLKTLNFAEVVHPDDRQGALDVARRLEAGEALSEVHSQFITRDGRKIYAEGSSTPRIVEGKLVSTRNIFRDVTERQLTQERAAFQNALLTAQYDVSPDGILVVGADDRILLYNKRFVELWNIVPESMETGDAEVIRQAVQNNLKDVDGWLRRTGEIYMHQERSSRDEIEFKDNRTFERYSAPIVTADGTYRGRMWFFHDVTESRRTAQDIRRVVQGTRAIFWRADVTPIDNPTPNEHPYDWVTTVSNPDTSMQYLPFNVPSGTSYGAALYVATLDEDHPRMDANAERAFRSGAEGYTQEYRVIDANGKLHWLYEDARITYLADGKLEVAGVSTDVTERKLAEQEVQKQNAYLNALQETSLGLMQRLDVNSLLQDIVARAGALVGTDNGYVFLRDADAEEMELRVGVGAYEGFVGRRTARGVGLAGQVWETNAPVVVDDYRTFGGRLTDASRDILRAVAGVPLRSGDETVGVIGLAYLDENRRFGEAEIQVLQRFAQLATISLDNARLYETAQLELNERARAESALAAQLRETELLNRVTGHAVSLDVDTALIQICGDLAEYFGVDQAGIALLSEDKQSLTVVADHSPQDMTSVIGYEIPVKGNPSAEIVLETRRAVAFADAQTDPRLASIHSLMRERKIASILIAPLFVRDDIIGTLGIDAYERREYTEGEVALVERVSVAISTALENARLYRSAQQEIAERRRAEQDIRQRNKELEVISRVSAVMTTNIDMVTALETLARELVETFRARNCGIALLNSEKTALTVVADALSEGHDEHAVGIVIPLEGNLSSQYVVNHRRSLVIPDAQTDPMTEPIHERMRQRHTKCLAIIPLMSGGDVIGTIGLDTTDPDHVFGDEEIRLAETMANQMANAIEKQRLFDQTKARARREQLTREIGANMTRSLDMEKILQTMARELSHALGASHAVVRMGSKEPDTNGGVGGNGGKSGNGGNGHT